MSYARFAGACALAVAAANLAYATSFLVVRPDNPDAGGTAASLFLLAGGVLALPVLLALRRRLAAVEPDFALLAFGLGVAGALGAAVHGGYDLANAINEPAAVPDLPSQVDPRGLLTFGATALSLGLVAWLARDPRAGLPAPVPALSAVLAALLAVVYLGRLVVVDADSAAIVAPAALAGFLASPAWYVVIGRALGGRYAARPSKIRFAPGSSPGDAAS